MAYSQLTDYQNVLSTAELIQITDINKSGNVNVSVLNEAIAQTDSVINSVLSAIYTLPLMTIPALIRTLSINMTICFLYRQRTDEPVPNKENFCISAEKTLGDIASGKLILNEINASKQSRVYSQLDETNIITTMDSLINY